MEKRNVTNMEESPEQEIPQFEEVEKGGKKYGNGKPPKVPKVQDYYVQEDTQGKNGVQKKKK